MDATPAQVAKRPKWKDDTEALICDEIGCDVKFGLRKRRHHCRGCGFVYCAEHCKATMVIPIFGYYTPQKVCHTCSIHGVVDPDAKPEKPEKKEKKKKDKKDKKDKKEKKKKKAAADSDSEEAPQQQVYPAQAPQQQVYPAQAPPPIPAAYPQQGYPATYQTPQYASPSPVPPYDSSPVPNADVEALQRRVVELEAVVKQVQLGVSIPNTPSVEFKDYDGDTITMHTAHGSLQYAVNGEDRPPFRVLRWHPDGPALEFKDIETAMLLQNDCHKIVKDVLRLVADAAVDHDLSLDAFCKECLQLKRCSKYCGVTGALHEPEAQNEVAQPVPATAALPSVTDLNKAQLHVAPPALHEPVFGDDGWSSESDDSDWDSPGCRGASRPAPPPSTLLAIAAPPAVAMRMQAPVPSSNRLAILPAQSHEVPVVVPVEAQTTPTAQPAYAVQAAPISPAPAMLVPSTPPPGAGSISGAPAPKNMIALQAAAGRVKLRSATITKKPEETPAEEQQEQFGKHMLKSTSNIHEGTETAPQKEESSLGQHLLKSTGNIHADPAKSEKEQAPAEEPQFGKHTLKTSKVHAEEEEKAETPVLGQHLLRSTANLKTESPKPSPAEDPPGQHMLKSSFNRKLEENAAPKETPKEEKEKEPAAPSKDDSSSEDEKPKKAAPKKAINKMIAQRRDDSDSDDSGDW